MYDIALYGHLTFDEVYFKGQYSTNVGGIANVWRALKNIDNALHIHVSPQAIGDSRIVLRNHSKDNYSKLNKVQCLIDIVDAKLSHVAYANELEGLNLINQLKGIKTADICTTHEQQGRELELEVANEFDFIFVSVEHTHLVPQKFKNRLVIHGPTETRVYKNGDRIAHFSNPSQYLEDINVLGAGDYFAACYIYGIIHGRNDDHCAEMSQRLTTKYLKDLHEKT